MDLSVSITSYSIALGVASSLLAWPVKKSLQVTLLKGEKVLQPAMKVFIEMLLTRKKLMLIPRVLMFGIVLPSAEELLYRGLLQRTLFCYCQEKRSYADTVGRVATSAALFSLAHARKGFSRNANKAVMASTFVGGLVYGALAEATGELTASIAAHSTHNSLVMLRVYQVVQKLR